MSEQHSNFDENRRAMGTLNPMRDKNMSMKASSGGGEGKTPVTTGPAAAAAAWTRAGFLPDSRCLLVFIYRRLCSGCNINITSK